MATGALRGGTEESAGPSRFEIRRRLGEGGMGVVYEAYDRVGRRLVALKMLRRLDAQGLYRFKREFRALQGIEHPNLIRYEELVAERGEWFLTMELVRGIDIVRYISGEDYRPDFVISAPDRPASSTRSTRGAPGGELELGRAAEVTRPARALGFDEGRLRASMGQLAQGLAALHASGRLHRDIKPPNVLVTPEGRTVLLDFGLTTGFGAGERGQHPGSWAKSTEMHTVGTAMYMAPEQAVSANVGPAADWYSFGVVLYEALTGRVPFIGSNLAVLLDKQRLAPPKPSEIAQSVPPELDALCVELLQRDPDARPTERSVLERLGVLGASIPEPALSSSRFTQAVPFVGREAELQFLDDAFQRTTRGEMASVFVVGKSGLGKTELVHRFIDLLSLKEERVVILSGRCYERESVPYKAFDGIVDSLCRYLRRLSEAEAGALMPRWAALLGRMFPVLQRVALIAAAPLTDTEEIDPQEQRTRMFRALRELLQRIADRERLVLYIDDFQWADADSLTMLGEVFHRPDPPAALLIATARTGGAGSEGDPVDTARGLLEETTTIRVRPLSNTAARELAGYLAPELAAKHGEVFERLVGEAAGHPLFIQELVRYLDAGHGTSPTSVTLEVSTWSRISMLDENARALLNVLVVAGAPITKQTAAAACKIGEADVDRAVGQLRVAFLARLAGGASAEGIEPYHDRIYGIVLARMDPEERKRLHARLAAAFVQVGLAATHTQALVRHLEAAGENERAAIAAGEAALRSSETLAFDQAARMYSECLRLGQHEGGKRRQLRVRLGEALVNAGRGAQAADAFLEAAEGADSTTRLECRRQAAEQLLICGRLERGVEVVSALLEEIGTSLPATPRRALARVLWSRVRLRLRGLRWKERHEREIPDSTMARLDVYKAVGVGLNLVDTIRGADFQARHLLLALDTGEPLRIGRALAHEACYLSTQGRRGRERARVLIAESRGILDRTGDVYLQMWVITAEGLVRYMGGEFSAARDRFVEAEELARERLIGKTWEVNSIRLFLVFTLRHLGDISALRGLTEDYMRDARRRGDFLTETSMRRARNIVWLALGKPERAVRDLARTAWVPPEDSFHLQHWYELESLGELALYRGRATEALEGYAEQFDTLSESLLNRVQIVRAISTWLRGRLALAAGESAEDTSPFLAIARRSAKRLRREDVPYGQICAALLGAGIASIEGKRAEAADLLARAARMAQEVGMSYCAAAAHHRHGQLASGEEGAAFSASADRWMRQQGVVAGAEFMQIIAPGFARR